MGFCRLIYELVYCHTELRQPVMYRHPDGSVKREPPAVSDSVAPRSFIADEATESGQVDIQVVG